MVVGAGMNSAEEGLHGFRMVTAVAEEAAVIVVGAGVISRIYDAHMGEGGCGLGNGEAVVIGHAGCTKTVRLCHDSAGVLHLRAGAEQACQSKH